MDAPFAYRMLVPSVAQATGLPPLAGYGLLMLVSCAALFIALERLAGVGGVLVVASLLPIMYARLFNYSGVVSMVEAALWAITLVALQRSVQHRRMLMLGIVIVGTLNRETGVFLVLLYMAMTRDWRGGVLLAAAWLAIYAGLRLAIEAERDYYTIEVIWHANTQSEITIQAIPGNLIFVPVYIAAAASWRYWHPRIRRAALVLPAYLAAVVVFGFWHEVRLLLPVLVVLAHGAALTLQQRGITSDTTPYHK